jgi:DNA-binding NarL/FixJ family response regulator
MLRQGVRSILENREGWWVVGEASNGPDALQLARETRPDIAILDYALSQINGLELTRAIKGELPRTEVLIYTTHDQESLLTEVLCAGARGYVLKSDGFLHLIDAVEALAVGQPYFSGAISETLLAHFIERGRGDRNPTALTPREREVVQLVAEGKINRNIAVVLNISIKTVETHRATAMHKLKLRSPAELVRYAVRHNIVVP